MCIYTQVRDHLLNQSKIIHTHSAWYNKVKLTTTPIYNMPTDPWVEYLICNRSE